MASREIFWNIDFSYVMYIIALLAMFFWLYSFYRRYKIWRIGKPCDCSKNLGKRVCAFIRTAIIDTLVHRRFLREPIPPPQRRLIGPGRDGQDPAPRRKGYPGRFHRKGPADHQFLPRARRQKTRLLQARPGRGEGLFYREGL